MSLRLFVSLAVSGIPLGAMYALQAMGIVLVYRTSGVFNFAQGAIGMTGAYLGSYLAVSMGMPVVPAMVLAVASAVGVGIAMERLTIRPVEGALPRTVITLGWLLGLQGLVGMLFGTAAGRGALRLFPSSVAFEFDSLAVVLAWDQLGVLAAALALALGLGVFLRSSAFGTAMRAVADDPEGARLLGIRAGRVQAAAWGLGAGMAGLAGVLVTPLLGTLDTTGLVILTIQALAAALIGGLSSLPLTLAGGVALGAAQPVIADLLGGTPGTNELVAFLVVLGALALRRRRGRVDVAEGGLRPMRLGAVPTGRRALGLAGGVAVAVLLVPFLGGAQWNYHVANTAAWALAVLSLVLLVGVVGQVSLSQAVLMAVGAYGAGMAHGAGLPFVVALVFGAVLAAGAAALVAVPAVRLRPLELAIVTLSLAFAADRWLYRWEPLVGSESVRPVARPDLTNDVAHGLAGARWFALLAMAVFLISALAVASLRRARTGATLTALRGSESATAAAGFWSAGVRLRGFAASGALAGAAGAVFAALTGAASSAPFDTTRSISLLAYAVIAGVGSVPGAVVGGLIVTLSTLNFGSGVSSAEAGSTVTFLTGISLIAVLLVDPRGLAGFVARVRGRWLPARAAEVVGDDAAAPTRSVKVPARRAS